MSTVREPEQTETPSLAPRTAQPAARVTPRGPASVLALQRAAGNRAVASALRGGGTATAPPGVVPVEAPPQLQPADEVATAGERGIAPPVPPAPPPPPGSGKNGVVQRQGLLDDLVEGATEVAGGVKDRIIGSVRDHAKSIPGYTLLTVVLGKDPVTDAPVERNGAALINGFLDIIPGSEKIRGPLAESKAIEKAGAWFDAEVPKLGITWEYIKELFDKVVAGLGAADLLDIPGAVAKVVRIFSEPIGRLKNFAVGAAKTLMEFIVEGAMALAGGAGAQVMGIIKRAGSAFDRIVEDPMGFLGNLVNAVKGGFQAFASNIGTHLKNGLIAWLTGSLGGIIKIPAKFDLPGVLGMVMDFLGLTWARVRGKLVKFIPEPILSKLEAAAGLIADLKKRGLAAITDRIAQFADGLIGTVMGGIKDWITNNIVTQAITKLISFFNPAGAIVQAAIAIYNTVMFFIERGKQIAALAESVFDSIEAIASGAIGGAVAKVEQALGRAVPVLLGFLARLIGLGDIATPVKKVMTEVQAFVDQALDKAINWVAGVAKKIAGALGFGKGKDKDKEGEEPAADLQPALRDAHGLLTAKDATAETVRAGLPALRTQHSLKVADLRPGGAPGTFHIHVQRAGDDTPDQQLAAGPEHPIPEGGLSIDDREAAGGQPPPWALANRHLAYYDAAQSCYRYRPGAGPGPTHIERYRPSFRQSTLEELASPAGPYGHLHTGGGEGLQAGLNRRHIAALEKIRSDLLQRLAELPVREALIELNNLGHPPEKETKAAIDASAKAYLRDKFNEYPNLWVGPAEENQEKGRQIGEVKRELKAKRAELEGVPAGSPDHQRLQSEIAALQARLDDARMDPEQYD